MERVLEAVEPGSWQDVFTTFEGAPPDQGMCTVGCMRAECASMLSERKESDREGKEASVPGPQDED